MRRLGQLLALLGLGLGGALCAGLYLPVHLAGLRWLIAVGLVKLGFASSLGLMAGGAVLQRIANRRPPALPAAPPAVPPHQESGHDL